MPDVNVALGDDDIAVSLTSADVAVDVSPLYTDAMALAAINSSPISPPSVETDQLSLGTDPTLQSFVGTNLSIDASGVLNASGTGGGTTEAVDISDDGTLIVADVTDINFGQNASVTDDQDGSVTVDTIDTDTNTQRTDEEIQDVLGASVVGSGATTTTYDDPTNTLTVDSTDTDTQLSDSEVQAAINADPDHGTTASHTYFSGSHDALTDVSSGDHHNYPLQTSDLAFDPATQSELNTHASTADAHHTKTVDTHAVDSQLSGTVTLSSGIATVSTGLTEPVQVYLDPSNGGSNASDVDVVASAFWESSAGEIVVEIEEDDSSVGNPTVGYDILTVN